MEITDFPYAVLRFQYQLARFPLQLIEQQVVAGMSSEAPTRLFYERWLGGLDATVGKMLGDPDLEKRGAALIERSDALRRAAQLDATATQNQERADDELKAKRDEQATIRAAEQKATAAAESKLDEAQAKRSDAASKRAQADQVEELASLERQKRQSERANDA